MYKNLNQLKSDLQNTLTFHDPHTIIHNPVEIRREAIDKLIYTAVFSPDETLRAKTQKIIRHIAREIGAHSSSIRNFYKAYGEGKVGGFTVPAMNLRMLTYDVARAIFRVAKQKNAAAFIIEIAKTESEYTDQPPDEFATTILAAAIKENYTSPVFIQGDHCQFNAEKWTGDKEVELKRVKNWVECLLEAGFRNIDIDGSTLVDLSKASLHAQQKDNAYVTAEVTKFIRDKESKRQRVKDFHHTSQYSDPMTLWNSDSAIAIGGEIGHIGEKNSNTEDFTAFMSQYLNLIPKDSGISKVSVQTGTSHGGIIGPDGKVQKMAVDFSVLENVGTLAQDKYHMAGAVQHGASTLPLDLFHKFVSVKTAEIHLSTGFQNLVYDTMPKELQAEMYTWLKKNLGKEWEEGWSEKQFIYKTRKKAWGPFKKQLWQLGREGKKPIIEAMEKYVGGIFEQLNIGNTVGEVEKYTKQQDIKRLGY